MSEQLQESGPATPMPESPSITDDGAAVFQDYWGVDRTEKWFLPDGKQFFEFTIMTEGQRADFQRKSSRDLVVQARTGDARVSTDPAGDRQQLIKTSVTGWYLMQKDVKDGKFYPAPFSQRSLESWLEKADPKLVDKLEFEIRLANPWLQNDMTVEQMEEQISDLKRMIDEKQKNDLGEGRS